MMRMSDSVRDLDEPKASKSAKSVSSTGKRNRRKTADSMRGRR